MASSLDQVTSEVLRLPRRERQVVFSSNRSGAWRIWTVQSDGSELRQLTKQETDDLGVDPMFSRDRKSILFTSTRGGKPGFRRVVEFLAPLSIRRPRQFLASCVAAAIEENREALSLTSCLSLTPPSPSGRGRGEGEALLQGHVFSQAFCG